MKASDLAASARDTASQARMKTADGVDANPIAALIGGLALGALAAAVLPRTRKEEELLGPVGAKINDRARTAAQSAMEAGQNKLDELGISKDSAIDKGARTRAVGRWRGEGDRHGRCVGCVEQLSVGSSAFMRRGSRGCPFFVFSSVWSPCP